MGIIEAFSKLLAESGFAALTWREIVMLIVSCVLLYLAIEKKFEPLLLLPIAFGMLLANLPEAGLMYDATVNGGAWYQSGIIRIIYGGVKSSLFPCLIFMCIGAMTDFGPLIANPISLLLGAAATLTPRPRRTMRTRRRTASLLLPAAISISSRSWRTMWPRSRSGSQIRAISTT